MLGLCRGLVSLSVLLPVALSAQTPQAPRDAGPPATYSATARLVMVDVVATDSHGNPIRDLSADDFVVLEDGVRVRLSSFAAKFGDVHAANFPLANHSAMTEPLRGPVPPGSPAGPAANRRTNAIPREGAATINLLLLDAVNAELADQAQGRREIVKLLKALPAGRPVAVFMLGSRLRMLQDVTEDSSDLIAAVNAVVSGKSLTLTTISDLNRQEADLIREAHLGTSEEILRRLRQAMAEQNAKALDDRVGTTLDALAQIAQTVAGYPGRKNLIWISSAFPFAVDPDFRLEYPYNVQRNYARAIRRVTSLLATSQVAVYPVDVRGLLTTFVDATLDPRRTDIQGKLIERNRQMVADPQATMADLAEQTGGKAFYNTNDLGAAIGESLALGSAYYSLSYVPRSEPLNGKFRRIEVKLAHRTATLAYRRGYYAFADESVLPHNALDQSVVQLLQKDTLGSTELTLEATIDRSSDGKVVVEYLVGPGQVSTRDVEGRKCELAIDFFAVAWDSQGRQTGRRIETVRVPAQSTSIDNIERAGLTKKVELPVKPGTTLVRVGVMDRHTGRIGTIDF